MQAAVSNSPAELCVLFKQILLLLPKIQGYKKVKSDAQINTVACKSNKTLGTSSVDFIVVLCESVVQF